MADYWLDLGGPAPAGPPLPLLASQLLGCTVTVRDGEAGLVYRGRLASYDYDTRLALVWVSAERLLGDPEWLYPEFPRRQYVRCSLGHLRPHTEGDTL
jgi:hypothetical protein